MVALQNLRRCHGQGLTAKPASANRGTSALGLQAADPWLPDSSAPCCRRTPGVGSLRSVSGPLWQPPARFAQPDSGRVVGLVHLVSAA